MAIRIKSIQIQKLGPLNNLNVDLGMLNLFYGRNESGKTYLTEFLLNSIFRHAKTWKLRDTNPEGSVHLQGLAEDITVFSPKSMKKIEDHWHEIDRGLPLNMARLLVVKGGELALTDSSPGGVNREILKNALTSQVLLDQLRNSIQPTIQKAEIIDGEISGKNQGQINDRNKLKNELRDIDNLINLIEEKYSRGLARQSEDQIELLEMQLGHQLQAKKHQAYLVSKKRQDLLNQRNKISDNIYLSLRDRVRDHKKLRKDLKDMGKKISSSQADVEIYHWLESAIKVWEEKELEKKRTPEMILMAVGGGLLSIGLIITILQNIFSWAYLFWVGVGSALVGGAILAYFGIELLKGIKNPAAAAERETIKDSYLGKFGHSLKGITGLRAEQSKYQEIHLKTKAYKEDVGKLETKLETEKKGIEQAFLEIFEEQIPELEWEPRVKAIKNQSDSLDSEISDLAIALTRFNLEESDYLSDPQDSEYDTQVQTELESQLSKIKNELDSHQAELETLKARATEWTRDEVSTPWSEVLHHLRTMRIEINHLLIDLTAEIVAKIGLSEILGNIEKEEDQKILKNINTEEVSNLLKKLTGKYQSLNLIDDQIYASDPYQEFPLRDLSTGAREQIQLALRLGIASHVSGGEQLFIILDDAFQHSDWNRREFLVQESVELARQGWQFIYLTMDDHIRDLFQKIAKPILKKKYKYFELG